jgi:hypothetical protein
MPYKCPSKNEVAFKIIMERLIDQIMILKATSFFDGHLMNTYMTFRITHHKSNNNFKSQLII